MNTIDVRFGNQEVQLLKNMVGKVMTKYKCDPFFYSTAVFGIVGFVVEGNAFILTNTTRPMDYYGATEDVAVMNFSQTDEQQICSMVEDNQMIDTPVGKMITGVDIVNEHQKLFQDGTQTYDVQLTRGVIFYFEDASELSLEKNVWFSEDITIGRGEGLLERFTPADEFSDDWEGNYRGECERFIMHFSDNQKQA